MTLGRYARRIGSGTVLTLGILGLVVALIQLGRVVGWDPTWRAFAVTPLQPPFFDMHVITDYAACAAKGVDAYAPHACNVANFNIPPTWLWLGSFGLDGSDSSWLSAVIIAAAAIMMVLLHQGRSWQHGVIALAAIVSPSVLMGVERGNLDLDLHITSTDEHADLFRGFNLMVRGLRDEVRLLEAIRDLAGELKLDILIQRIMSAPPCSWCGRSSRLRRPWRAGP